jgi:capsular polysaccharide biosynthesis protein
MDPIETVRALLIAAPAVQALVAGRIYPLRRPQAVPVPAVTLQRVSVTPQYHLGGWASLDGNAVQIDVFGETYAQATALARACRAALEGANHLMTSEADLYEPEVDPELYRIAQTWAVWTT